MMKTTWLAVLYLDTNSSVNATSQYVYLEINIIDCIFAVKKNTEAFGTN